MYKLVKIRAVAMVTKAAGTVCGQEARDGLVRATIHSREKTNQIRTKSDLIPEFKKSSS